MKKRFLKKALIVLVLLSVFTTTIIISTPEKVEAAVYYVAVPSVPPNLSQGSSGREVYVLQNFLNVLCGQNLVQDAQFGPATKTAVMTFQAYVGLYPDGIVGPATVNLMGYWSYYHPQGTPAATTATPTTTVAPTTAAPPVVTPTVDKVTTAMNGFLTSIGYSSVNQYWTYKVNTAEPNPKITSSVPRVKLADGTESSGYTGYSFSGGYQCYGFADYLGACISNAVPTQETGGWQKIAFTSSTKLKPGDIVRAPTSATSSHSAVVYTVDANGIATFVDCNNTNSSNNISKGVTFARRAGQNTIATIPNIEYILRNVNFVH